MRLVASMVGVGVLVCLGGCGFNVQESTIYTVPNWTKDGRIIARKQYTRSQSNLISNSVLEEVRNSIVVMDEDGSNEQALFDENEVSIQLVEMSPSGNYVAYIDANYNLKVFKNDGGWRLMWSKGIDSLVDRIEISPDETKIYMSIGTAEFFVYDLNGVELLHNTSGGGGGWIDSSNIIFGNHDLLRTTVINLNSQLITSYTDRIYPDVYVASQNAVYSDGGSQRIFIAVLDPESFTTVNITYTPYSYSDFTGRHISPDGTKMVMSYDSVENVGIYVLDIETSRIDQLK